MCGIGKKLDELNGKSKDKYYKKFDFFYRRTAFRSMTEYYKGQFKPVLDQWREGERKSAKNFASYFLGQASNFDFIFEQSASAWNGYCSSSLSDGTIPNDQQRLIVEEISRNLHSSLQDSFVRFENPEHATSSNGRLSELDKVALKTNLRKVDLFEKAFAFCVRAFRIDLGKWHLSEQHQMELVSAMLSITLSHHFKKDDI